MLLIKLNFNEIGVVNILCTYMFLLILSEYHNIKVPMCVHSKNIYMYCAINMWNAVMIFT